MIKVWRIFILHLASHARQVDISGVSLGRFRPAAWLDRERHKKAPSPTDRELQEKKTETTTTIWRGYDDDVLHWEEEEGG